MGDKPEKGTLAAAAPSEDDRRLIEGLLRGDGEALRVLDGWVEVVLRESAWLVRADREDVLQEVRIRLYRNLSLGRFDGRSALRTYAHRIAKNTCIDLSRRARLRTPRAGTPAASEAEPEPGPLAEWINRDLLAKMLVGIDAQDRRMLELAAVHQYSYAEIAAQMAIPEGTVKSRVSRCKQRILRRRRELLGSRETEG